jgi:hypothetical protein
VNGIRHLLSHGCHSTMQPSPPHTHTPTHARVFTLTGSRQRCGGVMCAMLMTMMRLSTKQPPAQSASMPAHLRRCAIIKQCLIYAAAVAVSTAAVAVSTAAVAVSTAAVAVAVPHRRASAANTIHVPPSCCPCPTTATTIWCCAAVVYCCWLDTPLGSSCGAGPGTAALCI